MTSGGYTLEQAKKLHGPMPTEQTPEQFKKSQQAFRDLEAIFVADGDFALARDIERERVHHAETMKIVERPTTQKER